MKIITVFLAATLLVTIQPVAAQTPTAKGQGAPVTKRQTKPGKRSRKRKPVTPLATSQIVTLPSGLSYIITRVGEGRLPRIGEKVIVNYTGILPSGIKFDSSLDRGRPFAFELGKGQVIKGWDEGIAKLRVGSQATFVVPPQLAYGERGRGPIPPNAALIFVVELMGIEEEPAAP